MNVKKQTLFVVSALVLVLMFSSFMVVANDPAFLTLSLFLQSPSYYTSGMSDQEILSVVGEGLDELSFSNQNFLFSYFDSQDCLNIARGTPEGMQIISDLTKPQIIALGRANARTLPCFSSE